jgi:putative phosphoribosyl transferase
MTAIRIPIGDSSALDSILLDGELIIPRNNDEMPKGIVLFAHGSGSSRHSPRNKYVAQVLQKDGLATMLVDLLTQEEEEVDTKAQKITYKIPGLVLNKFNISLLAKRLVSITDWLVQNPDTRNSIVGYFGASTGTAAALIAAAQRPDIVSAIVSRSGRPDLTGPNYIKLVKAPTLLVVGGKDAKNVIDLNKNALKELTAVEKKKVVEVPGATHLFEEPGTLEEVARLASGWFRCYFQIKQHNTNNSKKESQK